MNTQTGISLKLSRVIKADPETVFQAWTEPEQLKRWSAPEGMTVPLAEMDLTVGGRYHIRMRNDEGKEFNAFGVYREIDPPKRLSVPDGRSQDKSRGGLDQLPESSREDVRLRTKID
jgi:uncharacterized protein YndB with AHSA1/START domain